MVDENVDGVIERDRSKVYFCDSSGLGMSSFRLIVCGGFEKSGEASSMSEVSTSARLMDHSRRLLPQLPMSSERSITSSDCK